MLPYRLFVLIVAFMCPVFASPIPSPALAGFDLTSRKPREDYCTESIERYSPDKQQWMKFRHCLWVNPDSGNAELFTYIDDVQYWKISWYRPSNYLWSVDAHLIGELLVSNSGTASGTNVKREIGKIEDSIKPGRHEWNIGLGVDIDEGSQSLIYDAVFTFDIDSV
ncbi:hypothetical protein N7520_009705 [Penicillium odoratum]|uniref:uncharacterized protein n=1 Tax=Penicillium odoratum TaxID=1167516 RepID=UPI0025493B55|nr:uncharacterized protein N7520_009705 [Penicillium odoratum]KAJ5752788.1 hypothetical protein N7520_009705 [Penicillium odoratum]